MMTNIRRLAGRNRSPVNRLSDLGWGCFSLGGYFRRKPDSHPVGLHKGAGFGPAPLPSHHPSAKAE